MRVITGSARGRKLKTLEGTDLRPTTDKVKESMFNILQFCIEGRRVLDLFAGSGQLGIEALSRGAERATFVDASKNAVAVVKQNLQTVGLADNARVVCTDSISFLRTADQQYDIAFLDPPYGNGLLIKAMALLPEVMSEYGIVVCEHPSDEHLPDSFGGFELQKHYRFGKITLTVYRKEAQE